MGTKAHLVLPQEILDEVDRIAGKRKRSLFIAEATREKLERETFLRALGETSGAWTEENHPELSTAGGVERYVRERRRTYRTRLKRILDE